MKLPIDSIDWKNLEKTCRNLIYGLPPRIKINVCGHIYEIYTGILDAYPETLLGNPDRREKYRLNDEMLFFHRHPSLFSYILFYYIQGFIQRPINIPHDIFIEECRFFSIPINYDKDKNLIIDYNKIIINEKIKIKYFYLFSFLITILSCLILFFNDLSRLDFIYNEFLSNEQIIYNFILSKSIFIWIDICCTIWFIIEFYIQFFYFSNYEELNQNFHLFIDIISITPVILCLLINILSQWFPYVNLLYPFLICLKSFRILKFIRYISNLNLIRQTLFLSLNSLSITLILCCLFIILFGIIIYLIERIDPYSNIIDPNIGLYWAIETLTTIGFGKYIPHTYQGRILSIFACIFGLIILAIPIPIIFEKFQIIYQNSLKKKLWIKYY
ncbi:unnamed protein product [Rotaria sordida]|uniref:Uncharacterized protein n=1 Tax=Rotaria sordida TaxID=392033 RepID=A0A814MUZ9_9BILA|nr:unnamed protein product [Rotaria sordida]CAF1084448.1 unnamed protein product [Rotaria sordida]CAF1438643.1 unnamed protein product [Rotaria sordida]CAF3566047.1 unnamed protein product [Rotaria sordida]